MRCKLYTNIVIIYDNSLIFFVRIHGGPLLLIVNVKKNRVETYDLKGKKKYARRPRRVH